MNDFNLALANYLTRNKLTQAEFCRKTGYDKGQVSKWLKGTNKIGPKTVYRIQETFPDFAREMEHKINLSNSNKNNPNTGLTPQDNWQSIQSILGLIQSLKEEVENLKTALH